MSLTYPYRYIARVVVEAETPLSISSGDKGIETDSIVVLDANGLPYIPGTSLAGVFRHAVKDNTKNIDVDKYFGFQKGDEGHGSLINFSDARMLDQNGKVIDGIKVIDFDDPFMAAYRYLPVRQHTKINDKGTTVEGGKFDEQVVIAGTRFCFEIEMIAKEREEEFFRGVVLAELRKDTFRLGGGTRNGFGKLAVVKGELKYKELDLGNKTDLDAYVKKSSSLSEDWSAFVEDKNDTEISSEGWTKYEIKLKPEDFFLCGAGFGDSQADIIPVKETKVNWDSIPATTVEESKIILIPATSLKGALAHRVAYHYNKQKGYYAGDENAKTGSDNAAVKALFGSVVKTDDGVDVKATRGNVLFDDIVKYEKSALNNEIKVKDRYDKLFNHVAIDRFTGGALSGALFQNKAVYAKGLELNTVILVRDCVDAEYIAAFEKALEDLCKGLLPLGGGTGKGHGLFTGEWNKKQ